MFEQNERARRFYAAANSPFPTAPAAPSAPTMARKRSASCRLSAASLRGEHRARDRERRAPRALPKAHGREPGAAARRGRERARHARACQARAGEGTDSRDPRLIDHRRLPGGSLARGRRRGRGAPARRRRLLVPRRPRDTDRPRHALRPRLAHQGDRHRATRARPGRTWLVDTRRSGRRLVARAAEQRDHPAPVAHAHLRARAPPRLLSPRRGLADPHRPSSPRALRTTPGPVCYSDLNYILLGWALARCSGLPLARLFAETVATPLRMDETRFRPPRRLRERVAATELDGDQRLAPGARLGPRIPAETPGRSAVCRGTRDCSPRSTISGDSHPRCLLRTPIPSSPGTRSPR